MKKLILAGWTLCSLLGCLQAEFVYTAVSGLPTNFLPPPLSSENMPHNMKPTHLYSGPLARPQRSLYGWHAPPFHPPAVGLGQISKQELITLLQAAQEAVRPEPQPEPEPEPEPAPAPAAGAGGGSGAAGPPGGIPLTVSLPAFVPIQLSAMYTAPVPAGAAAEGAAAAAAGAGGPEVEEEGSEEEDDEEEEEEEEEEQPEPGPIYAPGPAKPFYPLYPPWSSRGAFNRGLVPFSARSAKTTQNSSKSGKTRSKSKSKSRKTKSKKSKSKSKKRNARKQVTSGKFNQHPAGSAPSIQALPPPPFLAHAPGPLKLVPSDQLLSNWK